MAVTGWGRVGCWRGVAGGRGQGCWGGRGRGMRTEKLGWGWQGNEDRDAGVGRWLLDAHPRSLFPEPTQRGLSQETIPSVLGLSK